MMKDITSEWTKSQGRKGSVEERREWTVDGETYAVDGRYVLLKPSEQERAVAKRLADNYGKSVELIPKIDFPLGKQTPDYVIDGERYDLKAPIGKSKNVLYNLVSKKKRQSSNFIFDLTNCPLSEEEIEQQVSGLYASRHTRFINKVVLWKKGRL